MKRNLILMATIAIMTIACESSNDSTPNGTIKFNDGLVQGLCVRNWDTNSDGELSYKEAAAVTDIGTVFKGSSIVQFPELKYFTGISNIADNAFQNCENLTMVTLPNQITTIGSSAFESCWNIVFVNIPNGVTSIGNNAFSSCCDLMDVKIPDGVTTIESSAFWNCESLTSVTIPDSVTKIGEHAFSSCESLTSLTIGDSVTGIGYAAFWGCESLISVYCKAVVPPSLTGLVFDFDRRYCTIYVPVESVEEYKCSIDWYEYADVIFGYEY